MMIPRLGSGPAAPFPPVSEALDEPNGLLAWGGGLEPERLLSAYRHGIFPWYGSGQPILWWSPDPRCVIRPAELHVSRRLARRLRQRPFRDTADTAFAEVVRACAAPRRDEPETWITPDMAQAYRRLHELGWAHSVEIWRGEALVGGIYGISLGGAFFGESMFSAETDASKFALVALCRQLVHWGHTLLDCQVTNPHLLRLGAVEMARPAFIGALGEALLLDTRRGAWSARWEPRL